MANSAKTLTYEQLGEKTQIPLEFIAAMNIVEKVTPGVPNEVKPDALSDTVIFSQITTDRINERTLHTYYKDPGNITLNDVVDDQNGNPIQRMRILFRTGSPLPEYPDSITRIAVKDLGNTWSILEASITGTYDGNGNFIPSLYQGPIFSSEVEDLLPQEFKSAVALTSDSRIYAQTVAVTLQQGLPNLSSYPPGTIKVVVTQIDPYNIRKEIDGRVISSAVTLTDSEIGALPDGEGGTFPGVVTVTKTLANYPPQTVDVGNATDTIVLSSEVKDLATRQTIKVTKVLNYNVNGPITTYETDKQGFVINRAVAVVPPNTPWVPSAGLAGSFSKIKQLDAQKASNIVETILLSNDIVANTYLSYGGMIDVEVPPVLTKLEVIPNADAGTGSYNESGTYNLSGAGNASIALRGSARASAGVIPDLVPTITRKYGRNIRCQHWVFPVYREHPSLITSDGLAPVALWNAYFGITGAVDPQGYNLNVWPLFSPVEHVFTLNGGHAAVDVNMSVNAADAVRVDYQGNIKQSGSSRSAGVGYQQQLELIQKVVTIPPTVHAALNVVIPVLFQSANSAGSIAVVPGTTAAINTVLSTASVQGSCNPTSVAATLNTQSIPVTNHYCYKFFCEYYSHGIVLVHFVVIKMENLI